MVRLLGGTNFVIALLGDQRVFVSDIAIVFGSIGHGWEPLV